MAGRCEFIESQRRIDLWFSTAAIFPARHADDARTVLASIVRNIFGTDPNWT